VLAVFLEPTFEGKSPQDRGETYAALQAAAARQGFPGEVVALWEDAAGRTRFIAPPQQQPFFELMKYGQLRAQINGTLELC
jgi:hypothetical protein